MGLLAGRSKSAHGFCPEELTLLDLIRPDPVPGAELQLPLLTDLLTVRLPDYNDETQLPSLAPLSASKQSPVPRPIVRVSPNQLASQLANSTFIRF
jgi:hypothetical protein